MSTEANDTFERRVDGEIDRLRACQREHTVSTCSACEHFVGCETRRAYVQAVYDSMSKGETGGFEF